MEGIWQLGIAIIAGLQSIGAWLVEPMRLVTFLGNEEFYLFVAPAIYWCLDAQLGLRVGLSLMITGVVNSTFKFALVGPRPYWYSPAVTAYSTETSFGVPSGHAQNAVVVWGVLAAWFKRPWAWISAIVIMLLIGFSRQYLAVHFPHDVLVGWIIGAGLLWAILKWEKPVSQWFSQRAVNRQIFSAFGVSLAFILIGVLVRGLVTSSGWTLPQAWVDTAMSADPLADPPDPLSLSGLISNAAVFFGLALGAILLRQNGGFQAGGPAWQRLVRFIIGLVGVFLLWYGLGEIFPRGEYFASYLLRYLRYSLVGLWIAGVAPLLFIRFRLAKAQ